MPARSRSQRTPHLCAVLAPALVLMLLASSAMAQRPGQPQSPWRQSIEAGVTYQFDADGDDGGSYAVTRSFVQPSIGYGWGPASSVGLSFGIGLDDYAFDGAGAVIGQDPWNRIERYSLSAPIRFGVDRRTGVIAVPTISWTAESGADLSDAVSVGGLLGVAYRVSDRLRVGPGVVVNSGIEESTSVLPIVLVDYNVSERVSLSTGGGSGGSSGPSLTLSWQASDALELGLSAGYRSERFRLDDDGPAPDGIGEETAASVSGSATYAILPNIQAGVVAGLSFAGELELRDSDGDLIDDEKTDPALFIGVNLGARW